MKKFIILSFFLCCVFAAQAVDFWVNNLRYYLCPDDCNSVFVRSRVDFDADAGTKAPSISGKVIIPDSVTSMWVGTFFTGCRALKQYNVAKDHLALSEVDGVLFSKDTTVLIAFPFAKTTTYILPSTVVKINPNVVSEWKQMTSLACSSAGNNVIESILQSPSLKELHLKIPTPPEVTTSSFKDFSVNKYRCLLYVPKGSKEAYQHAHYWNEFRNIIEE